MKKFNDDIQLKNTVTENIKFAEVTPANTFSQFLAHFPNLKKNNTGFYAFDGRNVDYQVIRQAAINKHIDVIPTERELTALI